MKPEPAREEDAAPEIVVRAKVRGEGQGARTIRNGETGRTLWIDAREIWYLHFGRGNSCRSAGSQDDKQSK